MGRPAASRWMGGPTGVAEGAGADAVPLGVDVRVGPGAGFRTGTEVEPSGGSTARSPVASTGSPGLVRR
ncbi:hypothetical protein [Streptomyces sp. NPDC058726]|uniref:hypothetical protein n=1 Tax=Streptomyces sp. NPDC058726 TaxID=3346611 RepID=UPI0036A370BB